MAVFDALAFNFVSSDDTEIDEEMGYEFDPPIPAGATQITDANGEATGLYAYQMITVKIQILMIRTYFHVTMYKESLFIRPT